MQKVLYGHKKSLPGTSPMEKIAGVLMSWCDLQAGVPREETVEILESRTSGSVIRSTVQIPVKTRVYLKSGIGVLDGLVVSCHPESVQFVLRVDKLCDVISGCELDSIDPGVLNVESFLTTAQEDALLAELAHAEYTLDS